MKKILFLSFIGISLLNPLTAAMTSRSTVTFENINISNPIRDLREFAETTILAQSTSEALFAQEEQKKKITAIEQEFTRKNKEILEKNQNELQKYNAAKSKAPRYGTVGSLVALATTWGIFKLPEIAQQGFYPKPLLLTSIAAIAGLSTYYCTAPDEPTIEKLPTNPANFPQEDDWQLHKPSHSSLQKIAAKFSTTDIKFLDIFMKIRTEDNDVLFSKLTTYYYSLKKFYPITSAFAQLSDLHTELDSILEPLQRILKQHDKLNTEQQRALANIHGTTEHVITYIIEPHLVNLKISDTFQTEEQQIALDRENERQQKLRSEELQQAQAKTALANEEVLRAAAATKACKEQELAAQAARQASEKQAAREVEQKKREIAETAARQEQTLLAKQQQKIARAQLYEQAMKNITLECDNIQSSSTATKEAKATAKTQRDAKLAELKSNYERNETDTNPRDCAQQ